MLKFKGVVGADRGYLSEEAYLIILITWLQQNFLVTRAQEGQKFKNETAVLTKEKVPDSSDINLRFAFSLSG